VCVCVHLWLFQLTEYPVYVLLEGAECDLYVDGEHVCHCRSLPMVLGLYAISFYVFNLSFLDNSVKTSLFLQKFAFHLNDPSQNSRVMRISRACNTLMDKLSKKRPAKAYCSRKSSQGTSETHPASGKVKSKTHLPVESATLACSGEVEVEDNNDIAYPLRAHPTKRARKVPQRLKE